MKQAEKIYMISDAAKKVEVEAHVLRYWEEELEIPAKRNEMGHRCYTEEDISRFRRVKELKEQGLQLKAIRQMLKKGDLKAPMILFEKNGDEYMQEVHTMSELQMNANESEMNKRHVLMVKKGEILPVEGKNITVQEESREQKSLRLQQLLKDMIKEAVHSNNQELCQEIKESLLKELDYQFRIQDEKADMRDEERIRMQEQHYHEIDELLRSLNQRGRRGRKAKRKNGNESAQKAVETEGKEKETKNVQNKGFGFLRKKRSIV
ncbi:chromosome-anchoring protein RacA [Lachnospiraceae bacterium]|nr:chromosome-anchoring protein RacA [Lachnospiraceae bacterium]GFI69343.1 chromosome-anchoring protein RacA [Lachnospiraceae bacterium]